MEKTYDRRVFLARLAAGAAGVALVGNMGYIFASPLPGRKKFSAIRIDFSKCAGCRTCEMSCSASNHPVMLNGETLDGIGNPAKSNIRVWHYNPDVDVPITCYLCDDSPCIAACPVPKDPDTKHKAIYRDKESGVIMCDTARCIGCTACAAACRLQRAGIIEPMEGTNYPSRMCTLCGGDPACVKNCPYGAISLEQVDMKDEYTGRSPDQLAEMLIKELYPNWN